MHKIQHIIWALLGAVCLSLALVWGCSKTTILNETQPERYQRETKEARTFTPKDTTDTMQHEITFGPTVIGWEVVDIEID